MPPGVGAQGQHTSSVKGSTVNVSGSAGHVISATATQLLGKTATVCKRATWPCTPTTLFATQAGAGRCGHGPQCADQTHLRGVGSGDFPQSPSVTPSVHKCPDVVSGTRDLAGQARHSSASVVTDDHLGTFSAHSLSTCYVLGAVSALGTRG